MSTRLSLEAPPPPTPPLDETRLSQVSEDSSPDTSPIPCEDRPPPNDIQSTSRSDADIGDAASQERDERSNSLTLEQFSLIHADIFRANSELDKKTTLTENAKILQALLEELPADSKLSSFRTSLSSLISWGQQIEQARSDPRDLTGVAIRIIYAIGALTTGDSITLPGGYPGNYLIYQITKTCDNKFDFQIINTGDGSKYHYESSLGLKTKIAPAFTVSGITLEELIGTKERLRTALFETLLIFYKGAFTIEESDDRQIYAAVAGYFPGKVISNKELNDDDFITAPRSKSSSWKSIMALMRQTMAKNDYKKFVFLLKKNTLISFFTENQRLLQEDSIQGRQARELITLSAKKLCIRTSKIAHNGFHSLSLEEIQEAENLAEFIVKKIDAYRKEFLTGNTVNASYDISEIKKPDIEVPRWVERSREPAKARHCFASIPSLDFEKHSFLENLQSFQSRYLSSGYTHSSTLKRQLIIDFVRKVPKPWSQGGVYESLCEKTSEEELPQAIIKLYHFFNAYTELGRIHGFERGIDKITIFSLYALIQDLSILLEEKKEIPPIDQLSSLFGFDVTSGDLATAANLMPSPYDRTEWENIRNHFLHIAPPRIIHQDSYDIPLDPSQNTKPADEKKALAYYLYEFTKRHFEKLNTIKPSQSPLEFVKEFFLGQLYFFRTGKSPSEEWYIETFHKIGFEHLPILNMASLYLHNLFTLRKKTPDLIQGEDCGFQIQAIYEAERFVPIGPMSDGTGQLIGLQSIDITKYKGIFDVSPFLKISLAQYSYWPNYRRLRPIEDPTQGMRQRSLMDIDDVRLRDIGRASAAEANLLNDPNLSIEIAQERVAEIKADMASTFGYQIIKSEAPKLLAEAERRVVVAQDEASFVIAHAATHNALRPIELLHFALVNPIAFENERIREDFLQQFFKLPIHSTKFSGGSFAQIEDPNFQLAFLKFLSRYKDSKIKFSSFIFAMKIGVLLFPYVKEDAFKKVLSSELEAINLELQRRTDSKEVYALHLLLALKEAFLFPTLFRPNPGSSESAAGAIASEAIDPELQKCFNSLLMSWMWIKIKAEKEPELDDIYQTLEDLIYPIFGLSTTEKLIDDTAIKEIVEKITGYKIAKDLRSRPVKHNPIARMFDNDDGICVDLFKGAITTRRDSLQLIDFDEVYHIDSFKEIFGDKKDFKFSLADSWYHFTDPIRGSFRVQTNPVFQLERSIDGGFARLHPRKPESYEYGEFKELIQHHCQILTSDFFCYEGEKGYYYLPIGENKETYFIPRKSSLTIQKIDIDSQEVLSEIIPISFLPESFKGIISRIEAPSFIYLEKKSDGSLTLVFSRYKSSSNTPLTFILSGDDWLLESNKSKKLSRAFEGKLIDQFESFLVLESISTKKHSALIPRCDYQNNFPSFAQGAKLDFDSISSKKERSCYEELPYFASYYSDLEIQSIFYDEIPFDQDRFQPSTAEHKLRLFYLAVGQANFETALSYLKQLPSSDIRTEAQRALGEICLNYLGKKEQTPESIALQMHLGYLLFYYEFTHASDPETDKKKEPRAINKISHLYNRYCDRIGHIPTSFRLSFEEESLLLQKFQVLTSAMKVRVASCPELLPREAIRPDVTFSSSWIILDTDLDVIEYITVERNPRALEELQQEARDALPGLTLIKLLNLVRTNPFIYDLVYEAREEEKARKDLYKILHLASCFTAKSAEEDTTEYRMINKLLLMLNDSKGPPPLGDLLVLMKKKSGDIPGDKIDAWTDRVVSYLNQLTRRKVLKLSRTASGNATSAYPQVEVIAPPHSILHADETFQCSIAPLMRGSRSSFIATPAEATLSWNGPVTEFGALRELATVKKQITENLISFNYGLCCSTDAIRELEKTALDQSDPLLKGPFEAAFDSFIKGFESIEEQERLIPDLDSAQLESMQATLDSPIAEIDSLLKVQLQEILDLANTSYESERLAKVSSGLLIGGVFKKVTIEQLRLLFLSSDKEAFKKACPQLNPQAIQDLYDKIGQYLYLGIHSKQMKRLAQAIEELKKELGSTSVKDALEHTGTMLRPEVVSKALALKAIATQRIKDNTSSQHLLFQYSSHMFRTRPDQQRVIEELTKPSDKLAQVLMGGGKTTVFAANLLAKACAEGKIAILITPNFQYEPVYRTIQNTLKSIFGIEVVTFQYKKEELNLQNLEAIELTLLRIQHSAIHQEPKVLLLRPETLQYLTLEWIESLNQIKKETYPSLTLLDKWRVLSHILELLKKEGYSLGDEVHVLLDIAKEIHIPIGKLHSVDQENISLVRDIFKIISNMSVALTTAQKEQLELQLSQSGEAPLEFTENPDGNFTIKIDRFLKLGENKQSYCSTKVYKEILLPTIAEALANSRGWKLDKEQKHSFCRYVLGDIDLRVQKALETEGVSGLTGQDAKDLKFLQDLKLLHSSSDSDEKKSADLIALSKYILSDLLPLLLSKTGNIHFGRTANAKNSGEVVPYVCANTPSSNKFGNHYEAIIYHFMCALMFGVEDEQIRQLFNIWNQKATHLSQGRVQYSDTPPSALCKHLFGILPCELDQKGNFETIKRLLKSDSPGFINRLFAIEENTVQTCVTYQKETISAHAHMLADLCKQFHGLSGTFHLEEFFLKLQEDPELDAQVNPLCIRAFLEKPSDVLLTQQTLPTPFIEENFKRLNDKERNQLYAILDPAGLFKDVENKTVAIALFKKLCAEGRSDIKAVIFFTRLHGSIAADYPVLMRVNSDEIELLNGTSIDELASKGLEPGDYAVYLDSHHCTGTDIPLPQNAVGFLTYDPGIGLDTTTQAMMRFRNYLINQSLVVVVPEYSCSLLPKTDRTIQDLVLEGNHLEAKKILVAQMIRKQVEQGSGKMIKAFKKMLEYAVFQTGKEILLHTTDPKALKQLANGFKSSFFHLTADTPYLSFGSLSEEVDTIESLAKTSTKILEQLKLDLQNAEIPNSKDYIDHIIARVEKEHKAILKKAESIKPHFIAKVMELISGTALKTEGTERELAITVQRENQIEQEVEQNIEQEVEQEIQDAHRQFQLRKKQDPKEIDQYDAAAFLQQVSSKSPIQGSVEPIKNLFGAPLEEYAPLFEESPLLMTSHFRQPFINTTNIFDASHAQARPFQYMLICKLAGNSYRAVIVSSFEASRLAAHLREKKCKDVWLTLPSGLLEAGDEPSWKTCCKQDDLKELMIPFNLLGANTAFVSNHIDEYTRWYHTQDQTPLKARNLRKLIKLIAVTHPLKKDQLLDYVDPTTLSKRLSYLEQLIRVLAFDNLESDLINADTAPLLSAFQLQNLTLQQVKSIAQYLRPDQIPHIPGKFIQELPVSKLGYLAANQVGYFTTKELIQSVSIKIIRQLKKEYLPEGSSLLDNLTQEQYFNLTDPELINELSIENLTFINPEMTKYMSPDAARVRHLITYDKIFFDHLSRDQLEVLSSEDDALELFNNIPLQAIAKLPLTESTEDHNGFVLFLTPAQMEQLTDDQIKKIKYGTDLGALPPLKWQHGNTEAIQQLSREDIRKIPMEELPEKETPQAEELCSSVEIDDEGVAEDEEYTYQEAEEGDHYDPSLYADDRAALPETVIQPVLRQIEPPPPVESLPQDAINSLLSRFSSEQIQALSPSQVKSLKDPNLYPSLSEEQVSWFTQTQYEKLTNDVLIQKIPADKLVYIQKEQTPKIGAIASRLRQLIVSGTTQCSHFGYLSREQLEALSKEADGDTLFHQIPLSAIENLNLTGQTKGCSGFIAHLSYNHRAKLTKGQIELIEHPEALALLEPVCWQHARKDVLHGLSASRIQQIPSEDITLLPLENLSEKQVHALTEYQVQNLKDPNLCPSLTATQVCFLTKEQYPILTLQELIEKVADDKLVHINPEMTPKIGASIHRLRKLIVSDQEFCPHFAYLTHEQLEILGKGEDRDTLFKKIPLDGIGRLELTKPTQELKIFITCLSEKQKERLTREQIALITEVTDLLLLQSACWQHASGELIKKLIPEQIKGIDLIGITSLLLLKFSPDQMQALTKEQVQSIEDPNVCLSLSDDHIALLTDIQYKKLNNAWLINKVPDEKLIHIDPKMTKHLGLNYNRLIKLALDAPGRYAEHFAYLTEDQLKLILQSRPSEPQLPDEPIFSRRLDFTLDITTKPASRIGLNLADKISPEAIPNLPLAPSLIKHLKQEQIEKLSPKQIEKIELLEDLLRLPHKLWQHGKESLLRQLPQDLIRTIPSQAITNLLLKALAPRQVECLTREQIQGITKPNEVIFSSVRNKENPTEVAVLANLPTSHFHFLSPRQIALISPSNKAEIARIMTIAVNRLTDPEPESQSDDISPDAFTRGRRHIRSIGNLAARFLPEGAEKTQIFWKRLEEATEGFKRSTLQPYSGSFWYFQASSQRNLEQLWDAVFQRPGSIIIDLTAESTDDRFDYYPETSSPWWYDPAADGRPKHSQKKKSRKVESCEPFAMSSEANDADDLDLSLLSYEDESDDLEAHSTDASQSVKDRKITVESVRTEKIGDAPIKIFRILRETKPTLRGKDFILMTGKNETDRIWPSDEGEALHKLIINGRQRALEQTLPQTAGVGVAEIALPKKYVPSLDVAQYHYSEWPTHGIITLEKLHTLIENIEKISYKKMKERKAHLETMEIEDLEHLKMTFWIRGDEHSGSADTLMVALALKQKFDAGRVEESHFDTAIEQIILGFRKTHGPQFLQSKDQLDLLRRYAHCIFPNITKLRSLSPSKRIEFLVQEKTKGIRQIGWERKIGELWPIVTQEIKSGKDLTAHRVGKGMSHRYFVACQAPTKSDWTLFWESIFEKDGTSIVDLTEHAAYGGMDGVYYPETENQTIAYGNMHVTYLSTSGIISTYQVTDTPTEPERTKTIKRLHYKKWMDKEAIKLEELKDLIEAVESLASDPKNPLWIHCHMGIGRTGTLITAMIIKEKIKNKQLTDENLENDLLDVILELRKERSTQFINSPVQFDLLYTYAKHLLAARDILSFEETNGEETGAMAILDLSMFSSEARSRPGKSSDLPSDKLMTTTLPPAISQPWSILPSIHRELYHKTMEIDTYSWTHTYDRIWPVQQETARPGECLTAHRVAKDISDRYFVAFTPPVQADWDLFWSSVFDKDVQCIVDLTENDNYAKGDGVYYPKNKGDNISIPSSSPKTIVECTDTFENLSTYTIERGGNTKTIRRYHYKNWADLTAITLEKLKDLIADVNCHTEGDPKKPVWIHCYMGVGRTGTLIAALVLKEKIEKGEVTKENLRTKFVDLIIGFRKERSRDFINAPQQIELLYRYANSLLSERPPPPEYTPQLAIRDFPAGVSAPLVTRTAPGGVSAPSNFIIDRGASGDCAPLSILHQLQQRGATKSDGRQFSSQNELRRIVNKYLTDNLDQLASLDLTDTNTPHGLFMAALEGSLGDMLGQRDGGIRKALSFESGTRLSVVQKKLLLGEYAKLIIKDGFWFDKGAFCALSLALGKKIAILRTDPHKPNELYIHERFPQGAVNLEETLFIYYNGDVLSGGNHYQSINLTSEHTDKLTNIIAEDLKKSWIDFLHDMKDVKRKQDKLSEQTERKRIEHKEEIDSAVKRQFADLAFGNPDAYTTLCSLVSEKLGRDISLETPVAHDTISALLEVSAELEQ